MSVINLLPPYCIKACIRTGNMIFRVVSFIFHPSLSSKKVIWLPTEGGCVDPSTALDVVQNKRFSMSALETPNY
jgi:hypothetical protein